MISTVCIIMQKVVLKTGVHSNVCIAPYPPDLDCDEIYYSNFRVIGSDPHGFDADNDGIGCES